MTTFFPHYTLNIRGTLFSLQKPAVMGIINVNSDSFFEKSRSANADQALAVAQQMTLDGADILDIGATSTRPGAALSQWQDEWAQLELPLKKIRQVLPNAIISVDTYHSQVVKRAADAGADIINDVSGGGFDAEMFEAVSATKLPYILMHTPAPPQAMQKQVFLHEPVAELLFYFSEKINKLHSLGVNDIIIDPGFGFGKTLEQNFTILRQLSDFKILGKPILVGISRKSMIQKTIQTTAQGALNGTTVLNTIALERGANILRVHDVKEAVECVKLVGEMRE